MSDNDLTKVEPPAPGTCGAVCHIFEWDSPAHAVCPPAQRCLCGQVIYGEVVARMQAPGR